MTLPKLSIAAKLNGIFGLIALAAVTLSWVALSNANRHAELTEEFEHAFSGAQNIERVNGLIYAIVMESRGVYMSADAASARRYAEGIDVNNYRLGKVMEDWKVIIRPDEAAKFDSFAKRIEQFRTFRHELSRLAKEQGPEAARRWGDNETNRDNRKLLNADLEEFSLTFPLRAKSIYSSIDTSIDNGAVLLSILAILTVACSMLGAVMISHSVAKPLKKITEVTTAVADGRAGVDVPFTGHNDEIGALARSIEVFKAAMTSNSELNRAVVADADSRTQRQETISAEIARFSGEVESTLADLGRIADQMRDASAQLANAADEASSKTQSATAASSDASNNVRDIASAADELTASVNEIDRQVAQSNTIVNKAVGEAERTNIAVKELDEAASRIGDVVRLITDIAEQTNLLALNATIEAARAGEAGRGFAVVAGEVKALAGQTGRATEDIRKQIGEMQTATARSIQAISAIEKTIREIGSISGAIAAAVTEQGAATQEIARGVEIAAQRTADTANEVNMVGSATDDTRANASAVKTVSEDLGQVAARIRSQVDQFFERLSA